MKVQFLDIARQHAPIQAELDATIEQVVKSGWYIGGEYVDRFENEFAKYLSVNHCVSCGNGTDALELILEAMGIGPDDEVIVPSFTWVSDAEAVARCGAKPVFADVNLTTFNLSVDNINPYITSQTKAIIAVHLFGLPCDMDPIKDLCEEHGIKLIEDCAQSHGAHYKDQKIGTIGDAALFSFYPTKNLGALGDGGAVVTNDKSLNDKIRLIKDHGQTQRDKHVLVGRNSRLDTIQAAILSVKLQYLDQWNKERERLADVYLNELANTNLALPISQKGRVWHQFTVLSEQRDDLRVHLSEAGVQTAIHYPTPIHKMTTFNNDLNLPNAEKIASQILSLPIYPGLTEAKQEYVIDMIKRF